MKIAIPCVGLDHINRGFESFARELFENVRGHCDAHLIKGSGTRGTNVHVLPSLRRNAGFYRFLPGSFFTEYRRYRYDCLSFGWQFLRLAAREKFDLVHFSDSVLGDFLLWARQKFGFKFKLLLSNGAPWPSDYCARFDAVQQVSQAHHAAGLRAGLLHSFLVPYGMNAARLQRPSGFSPEAARKKIGIPQNAFVVLSLAALNSSHKRIDWLIREVAKLDGSAFHLVMAGSREGETAALEKLAATELRGNFQFLNVPYEDVPELLWASDLFVLCSLDEGFGRVLVEAMAAGVPLLSHPHETARWLIGSNQSFVDMTCPGELAEKIKSLAQNPATRAEIAAANAGCVERFGWPSLVPQYLRMYEGVLKS